MIEGKIEVNENNYDNNDIMICDSEPSVFSNRWDGKTHFNFKFIFMFLVFIFAIMVGFNLLFPKTCSANSSLRSGKSLFNYYSCITCHTVNGNGGTLGPNLSSYGKLGKRFSWTMKVILNPDRYFKTGSKVEINGKKYYAVMPKYEYLTGKQVYKISAYLESLKR
ncbi:MAG: cytochrome c [Candidatus Acididesulfobacter guangdongensis]|uniref:Cytochrome c n=1 Tax=Acididesulfobacter guangdongensis TaxID=2597225 RepID=A0A519BIU9_ACIG2|nr:MAG: cytochrome c [Candidatus Acididesulfobacter guangdongensis]